MRCGAPLRSSAVWLSKMLRCRRSSGSNFASASTSVTSSSMTVNIAARLEGIAEPGGVCISDDAQRQVRGKVDFAFEDMGPQNLKNIVEPMRAWRLRMNASGSVAAPIDPPVESTQALALPDKPSIAVLPFQNMSGDPEQEYFADGMVEEIITALSRFKWLFVIARNSSFTFKGKAVDIKEVGRRLGVR